MKWLIFTVIAHILMPFIVTTLAVGLIEYWCQTLFQISPLTIGANGHGLAKSIAMIFWVVFMLMHIKFAIQWWFVTDLTT